MLVIVILVSILTSLRVLEDNAQKDVQTSKKGRLVSAPVTTRRRQLNSLHATTPDTIVGKVGGPNPGRVAPSLIPSK